MVEVVKDRLIEKFIAHMAVVRCPTSLFRSDEVPGDASGLRLGQHDIRGELPALVGDDEARLAAAVDEIGKLARDPPLRNRRVRDRCKAFLDHVINYVEDGEAPD